MNHINTLGGQNVRYLKIIQGGTYTKGLKGFEGIIQFYIYII
jgi:hypothetical protein